MAVADEPKSDMPRLKREGKAGRPQQVAGPHTGAPTRPRARSQRRRAPSRLVARIASGSLVEEPAGIEQSLNLFALNPCADRTVGKANADESERFRQGTAGQVLRPSEPLLVRSARRSPLLRGAAARPGWLARGRTSAVPLTLAQLPLLARAVPTELRLSEPLCPCALRPFERVKATSNRFPVDAELLGDRRLVLARTNAAADPLDVSIGQLRSCSHPRTVPRWDISWDIWAVASATPRSAAKPADKPKTAEGSQTKVVQS